MLTYVAGDGQLFTMVVEEIIDILQRSSRSGCRSMFFKISSLVQVLLIERIFSSSPMPAGSVLTTDMCTGLSQAPVSAAVLDEAVFGAVPATLGPVARPWLVLLLAHHLMLLACTQLTVTFIATKKMVFLLGLPHRRQAHIGFKLAHNRACHWQVLGVQLERHADR